MPTIERQIDALGGAHTSSEYGDGYSDALTDCLPIAADADALVEELIDHIKHGDAEHQSWLLGSLLSFFATRYVRPTPQPKPLDPPAAVVDGE